MRSMLVVMAVTMVLAACGKKAEPVPPPGYVKPTPATEQQQK
ncbi:hypothetical protein [Govanella unica]|uniref:Lipoprotein n=1 Tax=Govanella unica TaxID=2975056 RepID=A0A9X3TVQ9_9PROT|nr:hypothetical protein [Govania unica]MDA5192596.1 hypothetical protein [Govania unica]